MKLSEMIVALEEFKRVHGDLEVVAQTADGPWLIDETDFELRKIDLKSWKKKGSIYPGEDEVFYMFPN